MNQYIPVIGLEIHIQLKTRSKIFCGCPNQSDGGRPNTNICAICSGQPGSLPVANTEAIDKAILMGLALNCEIASTSKFDRKHYFYPDLPKGYQISQFDRPICGAGRVEISVAGTKDKSEIRETRPIRITRAHLEEDAGKLIHPPGAPYSLVDLNRAGTPLLEIVTEPDFRTPAEAVAFLQFLRTTARYLGVSDADMEKGHLRCDANISLKSVADGVSPDSVPLPDYKVEVKNMNSFKAVEEALHFEISRQQAALDSGERLLKETRGWSDAKQATQSQRVKEGSDDYRYFPEPDLPVLRISPERVEHIRQDLLQVELPAAKIHRFISEYGLPAGSAEQIAQDKEMAEYFEKTVSELGEWISVSGKKETEPFRAYTDAASWCIGPVSEHLNRTGRQVGDIRVAPENLAELIKMIQSDEVSKTAAKQVFAQMFETGGDPSVIVAELGLGQVSDTSALEKIVDDVIAQNPKVADDVRSGKQQAVGFLVGATMRASKGSANPQLVNDLILKKLSR